MAKTPSVTLTAFRPFSMERIADIDFLASKVKFSSTQITLPDKHNNMYIVTGKNLSFSKKDGVNGTLTGIELKLNGSTLYKIQGSGFWVKDFDGYDNGYKPGGDVEKLYGQTAEVAYWLRGNDTIKGSSGNDKLRGFNGDDTIYGNGGNDILAGNNGNDKLYGGAGNDLLEGGAGKNVLDGGSGNDTADYSWMGKGVNVNLAVTRAQKVASGGPTDTIINVENLTGTRYADKLIGNDGANVLNGGAGDDTLNGGAGNDQLIGGNGADTLLGGKGKDTLIGGAGKDTLNGGAGKDVFVFNAKLGSSNIDTILDFSHADDTIHLAKAVFTKLTKTGALNSKHFVANATGKAVDSNDYIVYNTTNGKLYYDADGSGSGKAVQFAVLGSHPKIDASDFVVI